MDLVGVPAQYLDVVWNDVKDRIGTVLEKASDDEYTVADIEKMLRNRDAQLWTTTDKDAVWVTQIVVKKAHKELLAWMFQADKLTDEHWRLNDYIHLWAKEQGCIKTRVVCRPGFEKEFIRHGWKKRHVTLTQEL